MKRLLLMAALGATAPLALAGPEILPISGVDRLNYDMQTGTVTPATPNTRGGQCIWCCGYEYVNYFWGAEPFLGEAGLDWGDLAGPANVGMLGFAEFTNSQAADGDLCGLVAIYAEENGWDSAGRVYVAGFLISNIPGSTHPPDEYWGYQWWVEIGTAFVLDGSDLDDDGLTDWGYFQFYSGRTPGCLHGPAICGALGLDPNNLPPECPGVEDAFDLFVNPSWNDSCFNFDPNIEPYYAGTYWFGGPPVFAQFYFELYAPSCPNQGESGRYCTADIDGSYDCIVDVADLVEFLRCWYWCPIDPGRCCCDLDPYDPWWPGDGDCDLHDLAELLTQYGDNCNWP